MPDFLDLYCTVFELPLLWAEESLLPWSFLIQRVLSDSIPLCIRVAFLRTFYNPDSCIFFFFWDEESRTWQLRCGHIIDLHDCVSLFPSNSQYFICFLDLLWVLNPNEESVTNPKIALQVVMVGSKVEILYMKVCLLCVFPHTSFHVYVHLNFICHFITGWLQILFLLFSQPSSLQLWISWCHQQTFPYRCCHLLFHVVYGQVEHNSS